MTGQWKRRIILSMDVEVDMGNRKNGYFGVKEGLPRFLSILEYFDVGADFFVSADVCRRFPGEVRSLLTRGNNVGNHGLSHQLLCRMNYEEQYRWLKESTRKFEETLGFRPKMFRAPNFSANGNTIRALENLGYSIDSSVLPGRVLRRFRFDQILWKYISGFRIYDFSEAPEGIYRPSEQNIAKKGRSRIIEVPLSQNPLRSGSPLSLGFLNDRGPKEVFRAIGMVQTDYVMILCHSWELIDLSKYYGKLHERFRRECSSDTSNLKDLIVAVSRKWNLSTLDEVVASHISKVVT